MESGENPEEFKDLIHSKFWKAKRGLLQLSGSTSTTSGQAKRSSSLETTDYENPPKHSTTLRHQTSLPLPPSKLATTTSPSPETSQSQTHQLKLDPRHPLPFYNKSPIRTPTQPFGSPGTVLPSPATTHTTPSIVPRTFHCEVFRFDSTDRERYSCSAISEEEEVFSPGASPALSTKSYDSPLIVLDSPAITISKLHLKDEPGSSSGTVESQMESQHHLMAARVHAGVATAMLQTSSGEQGHGHFGIPSSPISPLTPNTPLSPSPLFTDQIFQQGFLAELYKRRCHSDSDLPLTPEACRNEPTDLSMSGPTPPSAYIKPRKPIPHPLTIPTKGGSLESEHSTPQDSPLDLSIRGLHHGERFGSGSTSCESLSSRFLSSLAIPPNSAGFSPAVIRGDIASPNTRNSVALRYNLDVSPVVEQIPAGADLAFVCPMCGQMFSLHDRLAKHMASRHKSKPHDPNKSYPCDVCHRSFARSDMLTRHMRLHTGVKPYTCRVCGQVFSRSDHLSTHQRTHTGEKPYKCPQCPYSACRRDMITRHLRTHTRNSSSSSSELQTPNSASLSSASDSHSIDDRSKSSSGKGRENVPIKLERMESDPPMGETVGIIKMELSSSPSIHQYSSRPPSAASSITLDSPTSTLSPAAQLHLSSLSVNSPSMDSPSQTKE